MQLAPDRQPQPAPSDDPYRRHFIQTLIQAGIQIAKARREQAEHESLANGSNSRATDAA